MIDFTTITAIRTYSTDILTNVIKEVDWILEGQSTGNKYNVASTSTLPDPKPQQFMSLNDVTQEQLILWVSTTPKYLTAKSHITDYLQQKASDNILQTVPLPWVP